MTTVETRPALAGQMKGERMKAVIGSKRYDTDTAERLASWHNGCGYGDFNRCEETLYRTKSGALFLHGEGGALSPYSQSYEGGRSRGGGASIIPMSEALAVEWLEQHRCVEALEKHFPHCVTDA